MPTLPEFTNPPQLYYDEKESKKYSQNSRMAKIQAEIAERAIQLLEIDEKAPPFILDIGCGSGLSGKILSEQGYEWVGIDVSRSMLMLAESSVQNSGLLCHDIGVEFPFQDESFDYAISISVLQWLFQSFRTDHIPIKRIRTFFKSLYCTIRKSAVLQIYCTKKEIEILKTEAVKVGFYGGVVTDNENTKNCKNFLVLRKAKRQIKREKPISLRRRRHKGIKVE
ncbi:Williams Beuren syndrome chromosome region 22 protein [Glugoides intestinalis]